MKGTTAFVLAVGIALSGAARAGQSSVEGLLKIQVGGHLLTQEAGMLPSGVPDSHEAKGGVLGAVAFFANLGGRASYGLGMDIEGNRVDIGEQTFGIPTLRVMAQAELMSRVRSAERVWASEPYALVGLGWNFNSVGTEISYPLGAPAGVALDLDVEDSPALRLGLGVRKRMAKEGAMLGVEGGWKWNRGSYRMTFSGSPERSGDFNLSGFWMLLGVAVWL